MGTEYPVFQAGSEGLSRDELERKLRYRVLHLGTKEVEIVIGDYMKINAPAMDREALLQFERDVLSQETPVLQKHIINGDALTEEIDSHYMQELKAYVVKRKADLRGNVPAEES